MADNVFMAAVWNWYKVDGTGYLNAVCATQNGVRFARRPTQCWGDAIIHMLPTDIAGLGELQTSFGPWIRPAQIWKEDQLAGVLDENEDSKDSLHSSSHTLKSDAGVEEKKGMDKAKN